MERSVVPLSVAPLSVPVRTVLVWPVGNFLEPPLPPPGPKANPRRRRRRRPPPCPVRAGADDGPCRGTRSTPTSVPMHVGPRMRPSRWQGPLRTPPDGHGATAMSNDASGVGPVLPPTTVPRPDGLRGRPPPPPYGSSSGGRHLGGTCATQRRRRVRPKEPTTQTFVTLTRTRREVPILWKDDGQRGTIGATSGPRQRYRVGGLRGRARRRRPPRYGASR